MRKLSTFLMSSLCMVVALPALAVGLQLGHRPEIGAVAAPKTAKAGETVKITVSAKTEGGSGCGLWVKFGDGADQQLKMNRDEAKFPVTVEHAYKKNGKYTVSASGKEITTNKACKGSASAPRPTRPVRFIPPGPSPFDNATRPVRPDDMARYGAAAAHNDQAQLRPGQYSPRPTRRTVIDGPPAVADRGDTAATREDGRALHSSLRGERWLAASGSAGEHR